MIVVLRSQLEPVFITEVEGAEALFQQHLYPTWFSLLYCLDASQV